MDHREGGDGYKRIIVQGIVQGVGFRPYIFRLARRLNILGTVKNIGGAVEILASGTEVNLKLFVDGILNNDIPSAQIENIEIADVDCFFSEPFKIIESENNFLGESFVSPDLAACEKCISELENHTDRRYMHYFNTCVSCGPRFSVIEKLPYDRGHTSMDEFEMCDACDAEYNSSKDRRYHAETISCNGCGPHLIYRTSNETYIKNDAFNQAVAALKNGKIISIKGIGGYHFACSPYEKDAVISLRNLKGRDKKPFAVMFKDLEEIEKLCEVSSYEQELLKSSPHPITLLNIKKDNLKKNDFTNEVLFDDLRCGCFLPYTPLHHLLLKHMETLIMTSANKSDSPIIKDDQEMMALLKIANNNLHGVLYHERKIIRSVEDSVVNVVKNNQLQMIRRSRGYVPTPLHLKNRSRCTLLAMGGDLKASFCFVKNDHAYMSQYFGDLEDLGVNTVYASAIIDYKALFHIEPEFVLCDMHPNYFSSNYTKNLGLPIIYVQHHHAHIASVMAEHKINDKVIGVAFDGSGYGEDEAIWGGEFLVCEGKDYKRAGHLSYTKILGGDSSAQDARKTAACLLYENDIDNIEVFDDRINQIKPALDQNINTILSSSMGRIFDAVASILGICNENSYEGQCAIYLQRSAEKAYRNNVKPYRMKFDVKVENDNILICHHDILKTIYEQSFLNKNISQEAFALGFHIAVVDMVDKACQMLREAEGINKVALSGGVFQNSLLLNLSMDLLEDHDFEVFINNDTAPNDSSISLGQAFIGVALRQGGN